ncbi:MAG: hypothetical protein JSU67_13640 [Gammaproteobacteria bacterium]|nr:MAG: hypothetical protein EP300_14020 [Gammaproteobacteria bacterium]UCH39194.1 MAG: hypothetical protein JSU67_13640 [Gammaproteobacteria bacterium]
MYLIEITTVSGDYDASGQNAQIANPIQYGVRRIKRTDENSCPLIDTICGLEIAVFLTLHGLQERSSESIIPNLQPLFDQQR